jgi:DNA-binding Lrp family transcriptional regulator
MSHEAVMDALDRRIVNALQKELPLAERPYARLAAELGLAEAELLARARRLVAAGVASRVGPLYDAERMGGAFMLAALGAPEAEFERVAAAVNAMPEVAHNYAREHALNMWFVLATEDAAQIAAALERIARVTGCEVLAMARERTYALHLELDAHGGTP